MTYGIYKRFMRLPSLKFVQPCTEQS